MRERNLRVLLLIYLVPLVYFSEANILATAIGVMLPFSFTTESSESFSLQIILLTMQFVGLLTVGLVIKRQRRKKAKLVPRAISE